LSGLKGTVRETDQHRVVDLDPSVAEDQGRLHIVEFDHRIDYGKIEGVAIAVVIGVNRIGARVSVDAVALRKAIGKGMFDTGSFTHGLQRKNRDQNRPRYSNRN